MIQKLRGLARSEALGVFIQEPAAALRFQHGKLDGLEGLRRQRGRHTLTPLTNTSAELADDPDVNYVREW